AHLAFVSLIAVAATAQLAIGQSTTKPKPKAAQPTLIARPPYAQQYKIGDRVQVYYQNWYPARIREVGKGDYKGFYRVAFDQFERQRWVDDDEMRVIPAGATHPLAFLTGTYGCYRNARPKKPQLVDELYLEANGDYRMRDDVRLGRIFLTKDDKIVWQGGALDDADAHVDGKGMLHIVRTRHEHWADDDPKQMQCILK
nr:hypothetical protein [Gemmatimonadaceae bacterium]